MQVMIPIILVTRDKKRIESFLDTIVRKGNVPKEHVFKVYPLKKELSIDQVRLLKKEIKIKTSKSRLIILYDFDQAGVEAQNALLKTLEENTLRNQFVLICGNYHTILPTIQSRSKVIRLDDISLNNFLSQDTQKLIKSIEDKAGFRFLASKSLVKLSNQDANSLIESIIGYYRGLLLTNPNSYLIIKKALWLKMLLQRNNLNPQMAVDNLLIFVSKSSRMKS